MLSVLAPAWGRTQAMEVSAPFVTRLKAQSQGTSIVLTWQDSFDVRGPLSVYRHTAEITPETLSEAQLVAEVPYGAGACTDHPPDTRPYFYAVLASDAQGRRYDVLVAFRNKTLSASAIEDVGAPEQVAARVTGLRAESAPGMIRLSFSADRPGRTLILYRSTAAISRFADLVGAVALIVDPAALAYEDAPPAGIPFYYAMADEELVKLGKAVFVAGENATAAPVSVPLAEAPAQRAPAARPGAPSRAHAPCPILCSSAACTPARVSRPLRRCPRAGRSARPPARRWQPCSRAFRGSPGQPMRPVILDVDRVVTGGGEEFLLHAIVRDASAAADGAAAEERLQSFLSIRRDVRLEARARFYLGQALYFQQRSAEALVEMLLAADLYSAETRPWLDRCLEDLAATP